jgi:hypothetical protein
LPLELGVGCIVVQVPEVEFDGYGLVVSTWLDEEVLGTSDVVKLPLELVVGWTVVSAHEVEFDGKGLVVGT